MITVLFVLLPERELTTMNRIHTCQQRQVCLFTGEKTDWALESSVREVTMVSIWSTWLVEWSPDVDEWPYIVLVAHRYSVEGTYRISRNSNGPWWRLVSSDAERVAERTQKLISLLCGCRSSMGNLSFLGFSIFKGSVKRTWGVQVSKKATG